MTPYERGQRDMQRKAAKVCMTIAMDDSLTPGKEAIPAVYCAEQILSLPIVGEATNPGEQVSPQTGADRPQDELRANQSPARPGPSQECVMVPKIDLWEFMRSVLSQGASIYQDYIAGNHADYEQYSARLDIAARERAAMLTAREE